MCGVSGLLARARPQRFWAISMGRLRGLDRTVRELRPRVLGAPILADLGDGTAPARRRRLGRRVLAVGYGVVWAARPQAGRPEMPRPRRAMRTAMMNSDVGAANASIANAARATKANPAQRRQSAGNQALAATGAPSRWWGKRTTGTTARSATTRGKVAGRHESVDEPRQHTGLVASPS